MMGSRGRNHRVCGISFEVSLFLFLSFFFFFPPSVCFQNWLFIVLFFPIVSCLSFFHLFLQMLTSCLMIRPYSSSTLACRLVFQDKCSSKFSTQT